MKLIKFKNGTGKIYINMDKIAAIDCSDACDEGIDIYIAGNEYPFTVDESLENILQKIHNAELNKAFD